MQAKCGEFPRSMQKNWCPSGAIVLASPHFRRERFGPGCGDGAGPPGARPPQAAAAAATAVCHVRTTGLRALVWPPDEQDTVIAAAGHLLTQSSYAF